VLIVDDDFQVVHLLREVLGREGCEVEHAADGLSGLARIAAGGLDLVLLDLKLPGLCGFELCRRVRAAAPADGLHLPVIMVTVLGDVAERRLGFAAGADDYVPKPFDTQELLARACVWLRVRAEAKASRAALLQEQAAARAAERRAAQARLHGVTLAAREITHLLGNEMQAPLGFVELLQQEPGQLPATMHELLGLAAQSLHQASEYLDQLQNVVRVETKDTPVGLALDLERSSALGTACSS
jgi:DNA-binding response OmpR family regulator